MAHEGPVFCLWVCRDGLCSGGKDGKVMVWSLNLKPLVTFDLRSQSTGLDRTRIRSVCWLAKTILVGTIHSEVFEIDIESGTPNSLLTGHCAGKVSLMTSVCLCLCVSVCSCVRVCVHAMHPYIHACKYGCIDVARMCAKSRIAHSKSGLFRDLTRSKTCAGQRPADTPFEESVCDGGG